MMLTLPYLAGLFDGEGSIGIYKDGRGRFHLRSQLAQNVSHITEPVFEQLLEGWGGNLGRDHNRKGTCFNWQLNSATAAVFLRDLLPYLIFKRENKLN